MSAEELLARLDRVKRTGTGRWLARCPAHDDKLPSLSIRELDDGRILVHDFAGCGVERVLAAVGLEFDALFPEQPLDHHVRRERRPYLPSDIFEIVNTEIGIVVVIAGDMRAKRSISDVDYERLVLAYTRLHDIARAAYGKQ